MVYKNIWLLLYSITFSFFAVFNNDLVYCVLSFVSFRVLGYVEDMPAWMGAADLLVSKPGGMTSAEAMASGLPMAIYDPIPGQEERNSDQLLEKGVAIKCNEISILGYKVDRLLGEPERLKGMQAAARKMGRPHAAETVVQTLLSDPEHEPIHVDEEKQEEMAESVRKR